MVSDTGVIMEETLLQKRLRLIRVKTESDTAFKEAQRQLAEIDRTCPHEWGEITPDHIHHKGFYSPGDAPGTMGVDRQLPLHVPAKTEHRWKRVCEKCGKVEYTTQTKNKIEKTPEF